MAWIEIDNEYVPRVLNTEEFARLIVVPSDMFGQEYILQAEYIAGRPEIIAISGDKNQLIEVMREIAGLARGNVFIRSADIKRMMEESCRH